MFFDEMETCNPLGGHAGVHKLGNKPVSMYVYQCVFIYTYDRAVLLCSWKYTPRIKIYT